MKEQRIGGQVTNVYAYDSAVVESSVNVLENAFLYGTSTFAGSATTIVADASATVLGTAYATGNVVLKGSATFAGTVSGNVILDENATFTGSASGDIKIKDTATFTGQYGGTSAVYTPAIIFTGTTNNAWSTIGNWTDLNGNAATDLPVVGASIIINANISGGGDTPLLNTVTVSSNADLGQTLNVLNGLTFLGSSRLFNTTVTGNAVFNATSYNTGSIVGNATFNNDSYNEESVYGFATFNNSSYNKQGADVNAAVFNTSSYNAGTVTNAAVFNNYSYNSNTGTVQGNAVLNDPYTYNAGTINGATIDYRSVPYIEWASSNTFVYTNLNVTDLNNAIIYGSAQLNNRTLNDPLINSTFGINATNENFTTDGSAYATYKSTASSIQEGGYVYRDKNTNIYYSEAHAATAFVNAEFTINNISYATDNTGLGNSFKAWVTPLNDWPWTLTIYTNTNTNNLSGATAYSNKLLTTYPTSGTQIEYNGNDFNVGANGLLTYVNFAAVKIWENTNLGTLYTAATTATNLDGLTVYTDISLDNNTLVNQDFTRYPYSYAVSNGVATGYIFNSVDTDAGSHTLGMSIGSGGIADGGTVAYNPDSLTNFTSDGVYYTITNSILSFVSFNLGQDLWINSTDYNSTTANSSDLWNTAIYSNKELSAEATGGGTFVFNNVNHYVVQDADNNYAVTYIFEECNYIYIKLKGNNNAPSYAYYLTDFSAPVDDVYEECDGIVYYYAGPTQYTASTRSAHAKPWAGFTACNKQTPTTVYTDANVNALAIGVRLYTDMQKATIVNDGNFILNDDTHLATDASGDVDAITTCPY